MVNICLCSRKSFVIDLTDKKLLPTEIRSQRPFIYGILTYTRKFCVAKTFHRSKVSQYIHLKYGLLTYIHGLFSTLLVKRFPSLKYMLKIRRLKRYTNEVLSYTNGLFVTIGQKKTFKF